ncbi:MAG: DMT family transporter [Acidobacteriota bacterium]|nr:DMT family transporter [Acidobacteriota bacterium]
MSSPATLPGAPAEPTEPGEPTEPRRWPAFLLLVFVFLLWSNSFIAARLLVGDDLPAQERLGALQFVEMRFAPVALWCLGWFAFFGGARRQALELLRHHGLLVVVLAVCNVWGYNLAFGAGHQRVSAGTGALIIVLNPVLTFLLAVALRQERVSWRKALGLVVAFTGIYWVVVHGAGRAVEPAYLRDALLLLGAPVCWAFYTVLGKPLLADHSPLHLTFLVLGLGSLPALLFSGFDADLHQRLSHWGVERWGAALFLALGCTVLAFWLWYVALRRLSASTAAAFVFLNPPLALCFEWLWLDRRPTGDLLVGGVVVLAGVFLCVYRRPRRTVI